VCVCVNLAATVFLSVCVSADHNRELCCNSLTYQNCSLRCGLGGSKEPCPSWGPGSPRGRGSFGGIFQPIAKYRVYPLIGGSSDPSLRCQYCSNLLTVESQLTAFIVIPPALGGHVGIARSVRLSVPCHSCLGYRHAGCLQLSHHWPPEICGLRAPSTDGRRPAAIFGSMDWRRWPYLYETICDRRTVISVGHVVSPPPAQYLVWL